MIHHTIWLSDLEHSQIGDKCLVTGPEAHHALRVKRVVIGDPVRLIDGQGTLATGELINVSGSKSSPEMTIQIDSKVQQPALTPNLEIWCALPKGDRLDRMIDQLTQLGVSTFRPLLSERSQRKLSTYRPDKLTRIMIESCKQCHRAWAMKFDEPITFKDGISADHVIIADASGGNFLPDSVHSPQPHCVMLIGPEGGWSDEEREMIHSSHIQTTRLGRLVLRTETAACAAASIAMAQFPKTETAT